MTNMRRSLNCESTLQQFGRVNNTDAVFAYEAAAEERHRAETGEEASDGMRFVDNRFSLEVGGARIINNGFSFETEGSRTTRQTAATAETTRRRAARDANTVSVPSQSGYHVYQKVGTVEMQSWVDGGDCYVTDTGFVCGSTRRAAHRS